MKATYINAHKFIKVSYMIHIVCFSAQCTAAEATSPENGWR